MSQFPRKVLSVFLGLFFLFANPTYSSIIKIPPAGGGEIGYKDLICTEQDKANIYEIITTLSENGKLSLLFKQDHLKQLGTQINHVHPLKFLSTIFSNPRLRYCMYDIFDDYFKRNGFMDGLGPSLQKESEKGKLDPLLSDFAKEVNVAPELLRPHFQARDWENLVRKLMQS
ncbi:MAG TPA: hypothetical protein VLE89_08085 [Chlamydiales bacterium]|nr:hypothetical protein [Chlamydiales bacterium]